MSTSHSPGPWGMYDAKPIPVERVLGIPVHTTTDSYVPVAHVFWAAGEVEESRANARLIAAAPDLLAACRIATDFIVGHCPLSVVDVVGQLNDAIRKAEGAQS